MTPETPSRILDPIESAKLLHSELHKVLAQDRPIFHEDYNLGIQLSIKLVETLFPEVVEVVKVPFGENKFKV